MRKISADTSYELIASKLFRVRQNWKKIQYIVQNSDIDLQIILMASLVARRNEYHNFGHELGATEYGIRIATVMKLSRTEITTIAAALLFHDAGHRGIVHRYDEIRSIEIMESVTSEQDFKNIGLSKVTATEAMRDMITATIFPKNRGNINDAYAKIMQDADLAHLGQGLIYWLWASMGLVDEFNRNKPMTAVDFIYKEQEKFIAFLKTLSPEGDNVYLSEGAQKLFINPGKVVPQLKKLPVSVIEYAYAVRRDDVTLEEFEEEVLRLIQVSKGAE